VTSKEIFHQYFKNKLILCVSIGVGATLIRLLGGHETSFLFTSTFLLFFILSALLLGYLDYRFYEKSTPKIVAQLLDKAPLVNFQSAGFIKEDQNKIAGYINGYRIFLSPLINDQGDKQLIVLIPLKTKEGLDKYFTKYDDNFVFCLSDEVIFAQATLKSYDSEFNYGKIFTLLDNTTRSLRDNKIGPIQEVGHQPDYSFTDEFYANLIKAINWTEKIIADIPVKSQINFSTVLRQTNPDYDGTPFYRYENTWSGYAATPDISFNYHAVLTQVLEDRQDDSISFTDINHIGQILEFDIDVTTHDGAPCADSNGFVDESDIPPMDTWFYLTKTKLYCWIPKIFIGQMQNAIDVEILGSYRWIKDSDPALQIIISGKLKEAYNNGFYKSEDH